MRVRFDIRPHEDAAGRPGYAPWAGKSGCCVKRRCVIEGLGCPHSGRPYGRPKKSPILSLFNLQYSRVSSALKYPSIFRHVPPDLTRKKYKTGN
eukprot:423879-Amorphochlora_amoeboformis.AAC.3